MLATTVKLKILSPGGITKIYDSVSAAKYAPKPENVELGLIQGHSAHFNRVSPANTLKIKDEKYSGLISWFSGTPHTGT
jgi:hypothetical protein